MAAADTTREKAVQAARAWLKGMGSSAGLTDAQVLVGRQGDQVRPPKPYLTVVMLTDVGVGEATERRRINAGVPEVYYEQLRRMSLSVQAYGAGAAVWLERAEMLRGSPASLALLTAQGVTMRPGGGVVDLSQVVDTAFEDRWSQDWIVEYVKTTIDDPEEQTEMLAVETSVTAQRLPLSEVDPDAFTDDANYPS